MERRTFLRLFSAAAAAVGVQAATPPVLQKVVELAAAEGHVVTYAEINDLAIKHIVSGIEDAIFRQSPVLAFMKKHTQEERRFQWNEGAS